MLKNWRSQTTFWIWDVEKLHAAVARSTFWSQNAKKLTVSDHFLKLGCGKIARRCSEKHILKSKCTKHCMFGALFEVGMWKNCTPLWREAHLQVKMLKLTVSGHFLKCRCRKIVEKWHAAVAPSTFTSQNVQNTCVLCHFWRFHCAISLTH